LGKLFDSTTASAILDRLSLNGKFITLEGGPIEAKNNNGKKQRFKNI